MLSISDICCQQVNNRALIQICFKGIYFLVFLYFVGELNFCFLGELNFCFSRACWFNQNKNVPVEGQVLFFFTV